MEQQTVTIAKAGIHASLNARCSVLAAANPVYGQYDRTRRPQENIGLPDSLLSRFDLLFIVLDQLEPEFDRMLSEHVITSHQYRRPGTIMEPEPLNQISSLNLDDPEERNLDTPVWLRGGPAGVKNSNVSRRPTIGNNDGLPEDLFHKEFLRKFMHFAKNRIHPVLTDEAEESISTSYANMRAKQTRKNLPITARTLETIIRLSSAHAKLRLSDLVENVDVDVAMELLNFVLFHEIGADVSTYISQNKQSIEIVQSSASASASQTIQRKKNQNDDSLTSDENDDNDDDDDFGDDDLKLSKSSNKRISKSISEQKSKKRQITDEFIVDSQSERYQNIQRLLVTMNENNIVDTIDKEDIYNRLLESGDENQYSLTEFDAILLDMQKSNKVNKMKSLLLYVLFLMDVICFR